MADGQHLHVCTLATNATVGWRLGKVWSRVTFPEPLAAAPVVLSQVQSNADPHWVKTRAGTAPALRSGTPPRPASRWRREACRAKRRREEEEASATAHGTETIGWLAIEAGQGTWNGHLFEAIQTPAAVTHEWYSIAFAGSYAAAPRFVASQATYDGGDNCALRYQNLAAGAVQVKVEEDTTWDTETNHTTEAVAYLALEGDGLLTALSGPGGDSETSYYYFSGQRVAMRQDGLLYFIVGDHLGTTSAVFDAAGALHSQSRHYPYGTERWAAGALPTDYRFTGQRLNSQVNLYHMGAHLPNCKARMAVVKTSVVLSTVWCVARLENRDMAGRGAQLMFSYSGF